MSENRTATHNGPRGEPNERRKAKVEVLAAPLALGGCGTLMLIVALTQPAFLGNRIGPGLFAQIFAGAVVALTAVWLSFAAVQHPVMARRTERSPIVPGVALLGAVVAFIVLRPILGLVFTMMGVAVLASIGAGERTLRAFVVSALVSAGVAWAIGAALLPPTTALWPWSPHL